MAVGALNHGTVPMGNDGSYMPVGIWPTRSLRPRLKMEATQNFNPETRSIQWLQTNASAT